jgi:hypothetical protein
MRRAGRVAALSTSQGFSRDTAIGFTGSRGSQRRDGGVYRVGEREQRGRMCSAHTRSSGSERKQFAVDLYPTVMRIVSDDAGGGESEAPIPRDAQHFPFDMSE